MHNHALADDMHPIEWCIPDSPAQRFLEAHGYREVEWKRFHPGEGEGWVKMARIRVVDELWEAL